MTMNRKGENSFNMDEEKAKYGIGMEVYLKKKTGNIIFMNEHYITVEFNDGIKESFVWHELFEKYNSIIVDSEENEDLDMEPDEDSDEIETIIVDEEEPKDEE